MVIVVNDYCRGLVYNADNPCYVNLMWIGNDEIVIDLWCAILKRTRHFAQEETVPGNLVGIIEIIACEVLGSQRTVIIVCLEKYLDAEFLYCRICLVVAFLIDTFEYVPETVYLGRMCLREGR